MIKVFHPDRPDALQFYVVTIPICPMPEHPLAGVAESGLINIALLASDPEDAASRAVTIARSMYFRVEEAEGFPGVMLGEAVSHPKLRDLFECARMDGFAYEAYWLAIGKRADA